ncbi:DUF4153 domain-containing protein [Lewinella sp. W8]|uniref:DUF4153 domain-containing protein n=1 Tax=Lewinella sp. W8 TaxID=2528208 RepID=UPI0010676119|nr:DUF4173 domain-containing protein [Lewinella sp. W8]MTB50102.1 DUF4173 domain-containing protein [Lewinella sp. W8]
MTFLKNASPFLFSALAFAILFRHGELGLNVFLFDAVVLIAALWYRPELSKHRAFTWAVGGLLFSAGAVVIVHGPVSFLAHGISALLVLGFAQARELRFVWFGGLLGITSVFTGAARWQQLRDQPQGSASSAHHVPALRWLRQSLIPLLIALPFFALYALASEQFGAIFGELSRFKIFSRLWWDTLTFFLRFGLGALIITPLFLLAQRPSVLLEIAATFRDQLPRRHLERTKRPFFSPIALKEEYRRGVLTFAVLNLLLAIVNAMDLRYVWMSSEDLSAATLSQYVHAGTYSLICSILLAMVVVLYFFRGNLNFYTRGEWLGPLARLWIAQNALLAVSVGWRNYHYIRKYGLAEGRILVVFVLLLLLFGLLTLFRKVRHKLSVTYLLQANGLAVWFALLLFGAINWPGVITRYNLAATTRSEVDLYYLTHGLPGDNTFLLLQSEVINYIDLPYRKRRDAISAPKSWRSWNYADWRNIRAHKIHRAKFPVIKRDNPDTQPWTD